MWSRFHVSQTAAGSCLPGIRFISRLQRRRIGCGTIAGITSRGNDARTCTVRCAGGGNGFVISAGSCANRAAATCGIDGHRRWARSRSDHPNSNPNTHPDSRTHASAYAFSNADPNPNTHTDTDTDSPTHTTTYGIAEGGAKHNSVTDSRTHTSADAFSNADPNPNPYTYPDSVTDSDPNTHSLANSNSHAGNRPARDVRWNPGPRSVRSQEPR
ncbi:MAG: hypothetical protein OXH91_01905 [Chloroflexota bacterium]|nr:hypothetical protein [Chloroflexota bacterium]